MRSRGYGWSCARPICSHIRRAELRASRAPPTSRIHLPSSALGFADPFVPRLTHNELLVLQAWCVLHHFFQSKETADLQVRASKVKLASQMLAARTAEQFAQKPILGIPIAGGGEGDVHQRTRRGNIWAEDAAPFLAIAVLLVRSTNHAH